MLKFKGWWKWQEEMLFYESNRHPKRILERRERGRENKQTVTTLALTHYRNPCQSPLLQQTVVISASTGRSHVLLTLISVPHRHLGAESAWINPDSLSGSDSRRHCQSFSNDTHPASPYLLFPQACSAIKLSTLIPALIQWYSFPPLFPNFS